VLDRAAQFIGVCSSVKTCEIGENLLCFPKIHICDMGAPASIGPLDAKARERRKVLGIQRGKDEMLCDSRGPDVAI
jgi:hypothetical protein